MPRDYDDTYDLIREIQKIKPNYTTEKLEVLSHAQIYCILERLRKENAPQLDTRTNYARELRKKVKSVEEVDIVTEPDLEEFLTQSELELMYGTDGMIPSIAEKKIHVIGEEGIDAELNPDEPDSYPRLKR